MAHATNIDQVERLYEAKSPAFERLTACLGQVLQIDQSLLINQVKKDLSEQSYRAEVLEPRTIALLKSILGFCALYAMSGLLLMTRKTHLNHPVALIFDLWKGAAADVAELYYQPLAAHYPQHTHFTKTDTDPSARWRTVKNAPRDMKARLVMRGWPFLPLLLWSSCRWRIDLVRLFNNYYYQGLHQAGNLTGLTGKVFVSAGDVYFGGLKYGLVKRITGAQVFLIQQFVSNGGQTSMDNYRTCDQYFLFSQHQQVMMPHLQAKETFVCGSLPFQRKLLSLKSSGLQYDLAVVDHYPDDIPELSSAQAFYDLIGLVLQYMKLHPEKRVAYLPRPLRYAYIDTHGESARQKLAQLDALLAHGNFLYVKNQSSFETIAQSKVVITYTSMMWQEAIGLGKGVLVYNPEGNQARPHESTSPVVLTKNDYSAFASKVESLLNGQSLEALTQTREKYFPVLKDPYAIVFQQIDRVLV